MKKALTNRAMLCLLLAIVIIALLPVLSFAKSEKVQMIKKSGNEYIIYVSGLNEEFKFAFSNEDAEPDTTKFKDSALDSTVDGNHIAYVDNDIYNAYFKDKENVFLWVKKGEEYKLKAEKVQLKDSLSEEEIQAINNATQTITVEVGEKELPKETADGVTVSHKIGTIKITDDQSAKYSYKMVKATSGTKAAELIELAEKVNALNDSNTMYEKLSVYNAFKTTYNQLKPSATDKKWTNVENYTIEQPQESKKGDQYLVWIKKDQGQNSTVDIQIMVCNDGYTPEYEKQEVVIKETKLLPTTGDNIVLFVIAGIILALIVAVVVLKLKNKKETK